MTFRRLHVVIVTCEEINIGCIHNYKQKKPLSYFFRLTASSFFLLLSPFTYMYFEMKMRAFKLTLLKAPILTCIFSSLFSIYCLSY